MPQSENKSFRPGTLPSDEEAASCRAALIKEMLCDAFSPTAVKEAAKKLLSLQKQDLLAAFCLAAMDGDEDKVNALLLVMHPADDTECRAVISFALRFLKKSNIAPLKALILRETSGEEQTDFFTRTEAEAEKTDAEIYVPSLPRDIFIAYAPSDTDIAAKLTLFLESQGFSCFFGLRNLRRGYGAHAADYPDVYSAAENCKGVVFLSSKDSRALTCDALRIELPYILKNRPACKRIEFLLDEIGRKERNTANAFLKDFFAGKKPCKTAEALSAAVWQEIRGIDTDAKTCEDTYRQAVALLEKKQTEASLSSAVSLFENIPGYKDADAQKERCLAALHRLQIAKAENTVFFSNRHSKLLGAVQSLEEMKNLPGTDELLQTGREKLSGIEATKYTKQASVDRQRAFRLKTRKIRRRFYASLFSLTLVLAIVLSWIFYFSPRLEYGDALKYLAAKDYERAIPAFEELGDYSDSKEKLREALYAAYRQAENTEGYYRFGNRLLFGLYPQTQVTDSALIEKLNASATSPEAFLSYGSSAEEQGGDFMRYIDITEGEYRYRGVTFTAYRPKTVNAKSTADESFQDENGFKPGEIYWFRFEPLIWSILTSSDGRALCVCESIIDAAEFDGESNSYLDSSIRRRLNEDFRMTAFSDLQSGKILYLSVDNSEESTNPKADASHWNSGINPQAGESTSDGIFLLSVAEVTDEKLGFSPDLSAYDESRQKTVTDYAKCRGKPASSGASAGCGWWWLRSPDYRNTTSAHQVYSQGYADGCASIFSTAGGIVPALWINLE